MKLLLILLSTLLTGCIIKDATIQFGEVGVTDSGDQVLEPGTHFLPYYRSVTIYTTREQAMDAHIDLRTKDNKSFSGDFLLHYYLNTDSITLLHTKFGRGYKEIVVDPEFRDGVRAVFLQIRSDSLDILEKSAMESEIQDALTARLKPSYIVFNGIRVNKINLPNDLEIVIGLGLKREYQTIKTSRIQADKIRAIDTFLKNGSKDAMRILFQVYHDEDDKIVREYILDHVKSSNR